MSGRTVTRNHIKVVVRPRPAYAWRQRFRPQGRSDFARRHDVILAELAPEYGPQVS
jgi:hypothetical protein